MGHTNETPNLALPLFSDTDKPTWRGDFNYAMGVIDEVVHGKADKATIDFYVADYGAVGDGVTNDTPYIQAAIDAANAVGGGIVHLMRGKTCAWDGDIVIKNNVLLMGSKFGQLPTTHDLKAIGNTSRIRVGIWGSYAPAGVANISINGNAKGPSAVNDGMVRLEGVDISVGNLYITSAAGTGLYYNATQNTLTQNIHVNNNLRGIVLDNGSGGLLFNRCEVSNNGRGIAILDDNAASNAYPFGSAHIQFNTCIVEWYNNATNPLECLVDLQCGSNIQFLHCGFSNNYPTVASSAGAQVRVNNSAFPTIATNCEFSSCNFNGAADDTPIRVIGPQQVDVNGLTYVFNQTTGSTQTFYLQDTGIAGQVSINATTLLRFGGPIEIKNAVNGGTNANFFSKHYTPQNHEAKVIADWPLSGKLTGDGGMRWAIDGKGGIHWNDGSNYTDRASITYDEVVDKILYSNSNGNHQFDGTMSVSGLLSGSAISLTGALTVGGTSTITGKATRNGPYVTPHAPAVFAAGAVTLDASLYEIFYISISGSGSMTSLTINNAVDGQRIKIYFITTGGNQTLTWPATFLWPNSGAPAFTAGTGCNAIEMQWDAAAAKWLCLNKSI